MITTITYFLFLCNFVEMSGFLDNLTPIKNTQVFNATCGPIRGNIYQYNGTIVDGYLGIPFGKPPIGDSRFKKPEEIEIWTQPKDCYNYGPLCIQTGGNPFESAGGPHPGESGCLTLNVWAPRGSSKEFPNGRPVMVFVPGGGFATSGSSEYSNYSIAGTLPTKDVIVVTINYRLGVLGFFSTGDEVCRGNQGLWDQTLALQWVQKHIRSFGGDPSLVTVFGQSAGGMSTDLLSLSPQSRNLFKRFIPMSGSAFNGVALLTSQNQAKISREFAESHGFNGGDSMDLFNWFQNQSVGILTNFTAFNPPISGVNGFQPNLDGEFFPKPLNYLRRDAPKKEMMIGTTEYEGLLLVGPRLSSTPAIDLLREEANEAYGTENSQQIQNDFINYYTNGVNTSNDSLITNITINAVGDEILNCGIQISAQNAAEHGNDVYFYTFEYANLNDFGVLDSLLPFKAATHCTDLRYLLGDGVYGDFNPNANDFQMIDIMTTFYSNFAKYGTPNGKGPVVWEKFDVNRPERHFRISLPKSEMTNVYHNGRCQFVNSIDINTLRFQEIVFGRRNSRP